MPDEPVWTDAHTQQRMEQSARATVVRAWAARRRQTAVEMRLQAASMRVYTQAMRAGTPPRSPAPASHPDSDDLPIDARVQSAVVTERAKGVLAARYRCTPEQALYLLHEHSRRTNVSCADLAHQVVHHRGLPA